MKILDRIKIAKICKDNNLEEYAMQLIHNDKKGVLDSIYHLEEARRTNLLKLILESTKSNLQKEEYEITRRILFDEYYRQIQTKKYNDIVKPQLNKSIFELFFRR